MKPGLRSKPCILVKEPAFVLYCGVMFPLYKMRCIHFLGRLEESVSTDV